MGTAKPSFNVHQESYNPLKSAQAWGSKVKTHRTQMVVVVVVNNDYEAGGERSRAIEASSLRRGEDSYLCN